MHKPTTLAALAIAAMFVTGCGATHATHSAPVVHSGIGTALTTTQPPVPGNELAAWPGQDRLCTGCAAGVVAP